MTNPGNSSFPLVTQLDPVSAFIVAPRGHDQHMVLLGPAIVTGDHMAFKKALYGDQVTLRFGQVNASVFFFRGHLGVSVTVPTTLDGTTFRAGADIAIGVLGDRQVIGRTPSVLMDCLEALIELLRAKFKVLVPFGGGDELLKHFTDEATEGAAYNALEEVVINLRMASRLIGELGPRRERLIAKLRTWLSRRHRRTVVVIIDGGTAYEQLMRIFLKECGPEVRRFSGMVLDETSAKRGDPIKFIRLGQGDIARASGVELRQVGGASYICVYP